MGDAGRWREYRRRRREGHSVYRLELSDVELETFLEAAGLLLPGVEHSREAVALALKTWLESQI